MRFDVKVDGLDELIANCNKLGLSLTGDAGQKAADAMGAVVETHAKANVTNIPLIKSGALRGSIAHTPDGRGGYPASEIKPAVDYAIYHEMGTYKMPARPFLVPAVDEHHAEIVEAADQVLGAAITGMLP